MGNDTLRCVQRPPALRQRVAGTTAVLVSLALCLSAPVGAQGIDLGVRVVELLNRTISGRIDVRDVDFDAPSTVVLRDVTLRDPSGREVLRLQTLRASVSLRALLRRELHVTSLVLDEPQLDLVAHDGRLNLTAALQTRRYDSQGSRGVIRIDNVSLRRGSLGYVDEDGRRASLRGLTASGSVSIDGGAVEVRARDVEATHGSITVDGNDVALTSATMQTAHLIDDFMQIAGGRVVVAGASVDFDGGIGLAGAHQAALTGTVETPKSWRTTLLPDLPFDVPATSSSWVVGGTLEEPTVVVQGTVTAFAPRDVAVDGGEFSTELRNGRLTIHRARLRLGAGHVSASGRWQPKTGDVDLAVFGEGVPLSRVAAALGESEQKSDARVESQETLALRGTLSGATKGTAPLHVDAQLSGAIRGDVEGQVHIDDERMNLAVDVTFDGGATVAALGALDEGLRIGRGALRGTVGGSFDRPRVQGRINIHDAHVAGVPLTGVAGRLDIAPGRHVAVHGLDGRVAGGRLRGDIDAQLVGNDKVEGRVTVTGFDLAALADDVVGSGVAGVGDLVIDLGGIAGHPNAVIRLDAHDVAVRGEVLGSVVASARATRREISVLSAGIAGRLLEATAHDVTLVLAESGENVFADAALAGRLVVRRFDVSALSALDELDLRGTARGELSLGGQVSAPDIRGTLSITDVAARGGPLGDGRVTGHLSGDKLLRLDGTVVHGPSRSTLKLLLDRENDVIDASLTMDDVEVAPWLALAPEAVARMHGRVSGVATAAGTLDAPVIDVKLSSPHIAAGASEEMAGRFDMNANVEDGILHATLCALPSGSRDERGESPCGRHDRLWLAIDGPLDVESRAFDLSVDGFADLPHLDALVPALAKENLIVSVRAALDGHVRRGTRVGSPGSSQPDVDVIGRLELSALRVERQGAPALFLAEPVTAALDESTLRVPSSADDPPVILANSDGTMSMRARAHVSPERVDIEATGAFPLLLLKAASPAIANATGTADIDIDVSGDPRAGLVADGSVAPAAESSITLRANGLRFVFLGGALRLSPVDGAAGLVRLTLDELRMNVGGGDAVARGWLTVQAPATSEDESASDGAEAAGDEAPAQALRIVSVDLEAQARGIYLRRGDGRGEIAFELDLQGRAPSPLLAGEVRVTDAEIEQSFSLENFVLSFDRDDDPVSLKESLAPLGLDKMALNVDVNVVELRARADVSAFALDTLLGGHLRVHGNVAEPRLAGSLAAEGGEIAFPRARFDVTQLLLEFAPATRTAANQPLPTVLLSAHSEIPAGMAGNDMPLPIDLLLEGPVDAMVLDLVGTGGGGYSRADLLSLVIFGVPLEGGGESAAALRLLTGEVSSVLTDRLSERIEEQFGGDLQLSLVAAPSGGDPRFAAGWRWRIGRRLDLEGTLGGAFGAANAATTRAPNTITDAARLRLLIFDHLPVGEDVALEGRLMRSSLGTSGELRLGYRVFEGRRERDLWGALASIATSVGHDPRAENDEPLPSTSGGAVRSIEVTIEDGDERATAREEARLEASLAGLLEGAAVTHTADVSSLADEARRRLLALDRFRSVTCKVAQAPATLTCHVVRARPVRDVRIEGLPLGILERSFRQRLFLRGGDRIADDAASQQQLRLAEQERELVEYLDREGFHGADVEIELVPAPEDPPMIDLVVRIRGGAFVHVRDVVVDVGRRSRHAPMDVDAIADRFRHMCWRPDAIITGLLSGTLACYSHARTRELESDVERGLRALGYPEARVSVEPRFASAAGERCSTGSCVDLLVSVDSGPKLTAEIAIVPDPETQADVVDLPDVWTGAWRWARGVIEPVSRFFVTTWPDGGTAALDTDIVIDDLYAALTFDDARATDATEAEVSVAALREYLRQRGHPNAEVDVAHRYDAAGDVSVRFVVRPGAVVAIGDVRVLGMDAEQTKDVVKAAALDTQERGALSAGFLSPARIADDEAALRAALAARGFPEAVVESRTVPLPQTQDGTERRAVIFTVDEGPRFIVKSVEVHGDASLTGEVLAALSSCREPDGSAFSEDATARDCVGGPLIVDELAADEERVRALYAAHGYPRTEVNIEVAFDPDGARLRVTAASPSGAFEKARIGQVFFEGNAKTRDEVLRRELGLTDATGEPLDPLAVQEGVRRVRRSGVFSRVTLDYVGVEQPGTPVDVVVDVEERPSFTVDTSVGFSTERLFSLRLETLERNALGSLIEAGGLLDAGLFIGRASQAQARVAWPRILGSDFTAALTPFASYRDESSGTAIALDDPVRRLGDTFLGVGPRRRLAAAGTAASIDYAVNFFDRIHPDKLTIGLAYELRNEWNDLDAKPYRLFSPEALASVSGLADALAVDPVRCAALTPRVLYSDIDNPFDPLEGLSGELLFKASSPWWLAQDWFGVVVVGGSAYTTFARRFTLASRVTMRLGVAGEQKSCVDCSWALMQNDLLLLGGERSVRGYGENTIGVRGPLYSSALQPIGVDGVRAGLFGAHGGVELRVLALENFGIGDVKPAVFVDSGLVTDDVEDVANVGDRAQARELGLSVGAGLRYVMPVGPAVFDCALSPIHTTASGAPIAGCHLALGYTF